MRSSADLSLVTPPVPIPWRSTLRRLLATAMARAQDSASMVLRVMRHRPTRRALRQDLPWDVGMDRLAEQANPT